jgi:hypothetical protein
MARPCGCGGRAPGDPTGGTNSSNPPEHSGDPIPLATFAECSETYHGAFRSATIYIVGRGTDSETLYIKGHGDDARRHGRREDLTVDHVRATDLCHEAVVSLIGG